MAVNAIVRVDGDNVDQALSSSQTTEVTKKTSKKLQKRVAQKRPFTRRVFFCVEKMNLSA